MKKLLIALAAVIGLAFTSPQFIVHVPPTTVSNSWTGSGCGGGGCLVQTSFTSAQGWSGNYSQLCNDNVSGKPCFATQIAYCSSAGYTGDFNGHQTNFGNDGGDTVDQTESFCDAVITAANHSSGDGGKGYRHFRGTGTNLNGGGMGVTIPGTPATFWLSMTVRWSTGLSIGAPSMYAKDVYLHNANPYIVFGIETAGPGFDVGGTYNSNTGGSMSWQQYNGGSTSGDGNWHCWDLAVDAPNNRVALWIDGTSVYNGTPGTSITTSTFSDFEWGNNQNTATCTGGQGNCYTDFDDLKISTSLSWGQRIGCVGNST